MSHASRVLAVAVGGILLTGAATFGGWAIVTVDDVPEYLTAGKPYELSFMVRQHGVTPLAGMTPAIALTNGSHEMTITAKPGNVEGRYHATIIPPGPGQFTIRIASGFMTSSLTMLPIQAIVANAPAPGAMDAASRGHQLYYAKGCVSCHVRGDAGIDGWKFGPDLTPKRFVPDVVAAFLADPSKGPLVGSGSTMQPTAFSMALPRMPQLNLKPAEIAPLVAYLNSEGKVSKANR
jgi:hypothetical protein